MKAKTILIALVAGFLLAYSAAPQQAEAAQYCWKTWKSGSYHKHPSYNHWHGGYWVQKCKNMSVGQHPYTKSLESKYSGVYLPWRGYKWNEFKLIATWAGWKEWQIPKLWRVSTGESGRRWWAKSRSGSYVGLMQNRIGNGSMNERQLKNPVLNLIVSRWLYEKRGWQPWPVCGRR